MLVTRYRCSGVQGTAVQSDVQSCASVLHCPACVYSYNTFNNSVFAVSCCLLSSLVLLWCLLIGWKRSLVELIGSLPVLSGRSPMCQRSGMLDRLWAVYISCIVLITSLRVLPTYLWCWRPVFGDSFITSDFLFIWVDIILLQCF